MITKIRRATLDTGATFKAATIFENGIKSEFAKRFVSQPINRLFAHPVQIMGEDGASSVKEQLGEDIAAVGISRGKVDYIEVIGKDYFFGRARN